MTTTTTPTAPGPAIDEDLPRAIISSTTLATPIVLDTVDTPPVPLRSWSTMQRKRS